MNNNLVRKSSSTMFSEEEKHKALEQAYRFLAQRFLSAFELRQKMKRKQIDNDLIDYVEERLIYYDYINDERLSHQVLRYLMEEQKYGTFMIKQKMKLRGLEVPLDINSYDELSAGFRVIEKKYGATLGKISKLKVMNFLKNRGFSMSTISQICREFYSD